MPLINYIGNRQECLGTTSGFVRGNAPPPPSLNVEYLVVAGGTGGAARVGGSAGGVRSGSATIAWNTTLGINVGSGGVDLQNGQSSSMSGSTLGIVGIGGALYGGNSGNNFSVGVAGPGNTQGGGAGSSKNGNNGASGQNGDGGSGSVWVNGLWYGGGGGGVGDPALPSNPGYPGLGGGGTAQTGIGPDGLPYQLPGYNGRGGGAAGSSNKGGDGTIIIRYPNTVPRMGQGGTQFESGGYYYHEFSTGSAQFTYQFQ